MDAGHLVVLHETGTAPNMKRCYGSLPSGQQMVEATPYRHLPATIFAAGLRGSGIIAPPVEASPIRSNTSRVAAVALVRCSRLATGLTGIDFCSPALKPILPAAAIPQFSEYLRPSGRREANDCQRSGLVPTETNWEHSQLNSVYGEFQTHLESSELKALRGTCIDPESLKLIDRETCDETHEDCCHHPLL